MERSKVNMNEKPIQGSLELARGYRREGELNAAVEAYRKVIASDPMNVEAYSEIAESLNQLQLYEDAEVACEKALAISPELARPHFLLGHICALKQRFTESEAEFRKAIELDDHFIDSYIGLAATLSTQGRSSEAETCLKQAVEINPDSGSLYSALVSLYLQQTRYTESAHMARKAHRLAPSVKTLRQVIGTQIVIRPGLVGALLLGCMVLALAFRSILTVPLIAIPFTFTLVQGISLLKTERRSLGVVLLVACVSMLVLYVYTQVSGPFLFNK